MPIRAIYVIVTLGSSTHSLFRASHAGGNGVCLEVQKIAPLFFTLMWDLSWIYSIRKYVILMIMCTHDRLTNVYHEDLTAAVPPADRPPVGRWINASIYIYALFSRVLYGRQFGRKKKTRKFQLKKEKKHRQSTKIWDAIVLWFTSRVPLLIDT